MSKIAVHVFADPGHAWAAVPVAIYNAECKKLWKEA